MYFYVLLIYVSALLILLLLALPVLLLYCRNIFLKKCTLIAIVVDPSPDFFCTIMNNEDVHNTRPYISIRKLVSNKSIIISELYEVRMAQYFSNLQIFLLYKYSIKDNSHRYIK